MPEVCIVPYWQPGMSNEEWARLHSEYMECIARLGGIDDPRVAEMEQERHLAELIASYELHAQQDDPAAQFSAYGYLQQILALDPSYVPTIIIPEGAAPGPEGIEEPPPFLPPVEDIPPLPIDGPDGGIPVPVGAIAGSDLNSLVALGLIFL